MSTYIASIYGGKIYRGKMLTRWITVNMDRHPDFGGGTIEADLPDTQQHRAAYEGRIVREWSQVIEADE